MSGDVCPICGTPGRVVGSGTQHFEVDYLASIRGIVKEHRRRMGYRSAFAGCYSHPPQVHCRADGMTWPCDVERIRIVLSTPKETS